MNSLHFEKDVKNLKYTTELLSLVKNGKFSSEHDADIKINAIANEIRGDIIDVLPMNEITIIVSEYALRELHGDIRRTMIERNIPMLETEDVSDTAQARWNAVNAKAIKHYGIDYQTNIAMEECAELIKAVSKVKRFGLTKGNKDNLVEEIADVRIVIMQLMQMFDISDADITAEIDRKITRNEARMKSWEENKNADKA